jgi:Ni,Fe-hydrogenase III large subunit
MNLSDLKIELKKENFPFSLHRARVNSRQWQEVAACILENRGRLVTLWARNDRKGGATISVVYYLAANGLIWLDLALKNGKDEYPDLSDLFPAASRMQRTIADLFGLGAAGAIDTRPWLSHGDWPKDFHPLRVKPAIAPIRRKSRDIPYDFVEVAGVGVHEIAVGPVHAGIIEPGHFRFSVVGEKTLRLEERLGYTHKGVDKLFGEFAAIAGFRLAGRMSGDSTVAYSWAYCMALEAAWKWHVPKRALWLRAIHLELERIANHIGDLGALGNDAGFAFGLTQFMRLRELTLRLNKELFLHRLMMDSVIPGGVQNDLDVDGIAKLFEQCNFLRSEVTLLRTIYDDHAGLQDRFSGAGRVAFDLAQRLGLTGMAGRASGILEDARIDFASVPYSELQVKISEGITGDVAARVAIRFDEVFESLNLIEVLLANLPKGEIHSPTPNPRKNKNVEGAGWVEGWRGGIFVALRTDRRGQIERCHVHDPSWQNWPVLEHAVIGDIIPDFPLINKSFNLTYSGHDR